MGLKCHLIYLYYYYIKHLLPKDKRLYNLHVNTLEKKIKPPPPLEARDQGLIEEDN